VLFIDEKFQCRGLERQTSSGRFGITNGNLMVWVYLPKSFPSHVRSVGRTGKRLLGPPTIVKGFGDNGASANGLEGARKPLDVDAMGLNICSLICCPSEPGCGRGLIVRLRVRVGGGAVGLIDQYPPWPGSERSAFKNRSFFDRFCKSVRYSTSLAYMPNII